jgi:D-alanyl-lipoteichoic acid acyltransferase DltB (MBOAT superfamily)
MLFNSYPFLFALLPLALVGYFMIARFGPRAACTWIFIVSIVFYGWWNPRYVPLLLLSIAFNYLAGNWIIALKDRPATRKPVLLGAIAANLLLLVYYKYLFPTLGFLNEVTGIRFTETESVVLPLGISFFTFTQIAYLVDCTAVTAKRTSPAFYGAFVTFFPHLIAGPILHHSEMIPQYENPATYKPRLDNFAVGLTIFIFGLAKKILLADRFIPQVDAVFNHPDTVGIAGAWLGILSYSLELYFDFSGYSDMAIGLARLFGVNFPLNFNSPYKSASIIDFWQRWHMTLTRFLTAYLYNPLAFAIARRQAGTTRRGARMSLKAFGESYVFPLFYTFVLAGIWHGAGLQYIVFGLLHAIYLTINHAYRIFLRPPRRKGAPPDHPAVHAAYVAITYLAVVLGQVFFRASSVGNARDVLAAAFGGGSAAGTPAEWTAWAMLTAGFAIVWFMPNVAEMLSAYRPSLTRIRTEATGLLAWKPALGWSMAIGGLGMLCLFAMKSATVFIYFQF